MWWELGQGGDPRKDQIDTDAPVFELDDGNKGLLDSSQAGDSAWWGHLVKQIRKILEVVLAGDVTRSGNEGIDIRTRAVYT